MRSLDGLGPAARAEAERQLGEQSRRRDVTAGLPGFAPAPLVLPSLVAGTEVATVNPRMRQDTQPKLNKLETRYLEEVLLHRYKADQIRSQDHRLRLANGAWYKPDFFIHHENLFIEVKGPKAFRGGFEFLKIAKAVHPEYRFVLVWVAKRGGPWERQEVLE